MKKNKMVIFCGVQDMDGNAVKLSKEKQEEFVKNISDNGKNKVVFCGDNAIPDMVKAVAAVKVINK